MAAWCGIYDDRLVVQEGGLRAVLSMSQRELVGGMASVGGNGGGSIDPNAIASCNDLLLAAPAAQIFPRSVLTAPRWFSVLA